MWLDDHWALTLHTPAGAVPVTLRMAGAHNAKNALAAATCALAAGAPLAAIRKGLESFEPVKGRSQLKTITLRGQSVALIDDSYNANPDSVRAAIDVLATMRAPRALLLGDMGEVGTRGPEFHAEVGAYAKERGIEQFWCAGALCAHAANAFGGVARHFADAPAMVSGDRRAAGRRLAADQRARASCRWSAWCRHFKNKRTTEHAAQPRPMVAVDVPRSPRLPARLPVPHLPRRARGDDGAADRPGLRAVGDPPPGRTEDRPADPRVRRAVAPGQARHADDGRRADPDGDRRLHRVVVRLEQPLRLGGDARHLRLRHDRLGR